MHDIRNVTHYLFSLFEIIKIDLRHTLTPLEIITVAITTVHHHPVTILLKRTPNFRNNSLSAHRCSPYRSGPPIYYYLLFPKIILIYLIIPSQANTEYLSGTQLRHWSFHSCSPQKLLILLKVNHKIYKVNQNIIKS